MMGQKFLLCSPCLHRHCPPHCCPPPPQAPTTLFSLHGKNLETVLQFSPCLPFPPSPTPAVPSDFHRQSRCPCQLSGVSAEVVGACLLLQGPPSQEHPAVLVFFPPLSPALTRLQLGAVVAQGSTLGSRLPLPGYSVRDKRDFGCYLHTGHSRYAPSGTLR